LRYLSKNVGLLEDYYVIFFGRKGWLVTFEEILAEYNLDNAALQDKIIWLDFVPNNIRDLIYRSAEFMVFPSLYEGFGLPVGEAMTYGCPVCASFSSSIPEVGGNAAIYFDPTDETSLDAALGTMKSQLAENQEGIRSKSAMQSKKFLWATFSQSIIDKSNEFLSE
jgi:glycosyltransferase involved in cell wall biosynthesis